MLNDLKRLRLLESQLRRQLGAWNHYRLRVWQECNSFDSASIMDRIRIAEEFLADPHRGDWVWALGGYALLAAEVEKKLSHPDPHVRLEADFALRELRGVSQKS